MHRTKTTARLPTHALPITIRPTREKYAEIEASAKQQGQTVSVYVMTVLGWEIPKKTGRPKKESQNEKLS